MSPEKTHFAKTENYLRNKWSEDDTFSTSVKNNNDNEYVFFDGPPFANGLPHYGHLLTGFIKDIYARYHTMKGKKVERRFGWDCHGLPAEMGVEKTLTTNKTKIIDEEGKSREFSGGKHDVKHLLPDSKRSYVVDGFDGIEEFNRLCRADVQKYTNEWKEYVIKQGRWVDFDGGYRTMDIQYMESVMWAFNELYKNGLIYEDFRVMPYSWRCQTPVSNFEIKMDNAYRQHESKSVYLKFRLKNIPDFIQKTFPKCKNCYLLAWTTTPWTLPSNLALAVNAQIDYCAFEKDGDIYVCANSLKEKVKKMLNNNALKSSKQ